MVRTVSYQQGPHTRVYVTKRSWLDAGTEVLPGDRKFQDYAFPPAIGYPSFARENNNRPIDRQPLNPPSDLGGYPRSFRCIDGRPSSTRARMRLDANARLDERRMSFARRSLDDILALTRAASAIPSGSPRPSASC